MEFNDKELKMIEWLKTQHTAWPSMRWIILIASCICLTVYFTGYYNDLALLVVGAMGLSHTLGSWSGRAEVSLLLKLVNESRSQDAAKK